MMLNGLNIFNTLSTIWKIPPTEAAIQKRAYMSMPAPFCMGGVASGCGAPELSRPRPLSVAPNIA